MLTIISEDQAYRARDHRDPGHFWADKELVDDHLPDIGVYGFAVYMLLCYHARSNTGRCWPSIKGMASRLNISEPTVRSALETLSAAKLIHISAGHKASKNGKQIPLPHTYTLLNLKPDEAEGVVNQVDQGGKPHLPGVVNQVDPNNNNINKNNITREESLSNSLRASTEISSKPEPAQSLKEESGKEPLPVPQGSPMLAGAAATPPASLMAPEGYQLLSSSASPSLTHLAKASANFETARPLCKGKLQHRVKAGEPIGDHPRCEECWKIAAIPLKPKRKRPDLVPPSQEVEELLSVKVYGSVGSCKITKNHWAIVSCYSGLLKCGFPVDKENINKFCTAFRDPDKGHWKGQRGEWPSLSDFTAYWCAVMEGKGFREDNGNGHKQQTEPAGVLRGQRQENGSGEEKRPIPATWGGQHLQKRT